MNIAGIGVGGKGASDIANVDHENIVALCDVDEVNGAGSFKKYPKAKRYKDFRIMLEKEGKGIDAVTVSTPDHMHAPASLLAMRMGKDVYCQKPLTHTVHEARQMTLVARRRRDTDGQSRSFQPGNAAFGRTDQAGVLGKVHEVHV